MTQASRLANTAALMPSSQQATQPCNSTPGHSTTFEVTRAAPQPGCSSKGSGAQQKLPNCSGEISSFTPIHAITLTC